MNLFRHLLSYLGIAVLLTAQETPAGLARLALDRLENGSTQEFDAIVPILEAQKVVRHAREAKLSLRPGIARVLRESGDTAILLLSGHLQGIGNSGDETILSSGVSGLYEASRTGPTWRITRALPIETTGRIQRHELDVDVTPGGQLGVTARLAVTGAAGYGLVLRLNHTARLDKVAWRDRPAEHAFGGGLLWVNAQGDGELSLRYSIDVECRPGQANSSCFLPHAGHVRDQYMWQPFFGINSERDQAGMSVRVRIPSAFQVATTLPQTERVEGDVRIVEGRSVYPTSSLALFYDRDWQVHSESIGGTRLEIFATRGFEPSPAKMIEEFRRVNELLSRRFGRPQDLAIIQARARGDNGWRHLTNHGLVAGVNAGEFLRGGSYPQAAFAHEVAHSWTRGAGGGANLIREGWATFCESLVLRERLGADVERTFWEVQARSFFDTFDGKARLDQDPLNSGVAYSKGSWVFRMLSQRLGRDKFDAVMSRLARVSQQRPASVEDLMEISGEHEFLKPWIFGIRAPALRARTEGSSLILEQMDELFDLDVKVRVETPGGAIDRQVPIRARTTKVDFGQPIHTPIVDPDGQLLLRR